MTSTITAMEVSAERSRLRVRLRTTSIAILRCRAINAMAVTTSGATTRKVGCVMISRYVRMPPDIVSVSCYSHLSVFIRGELLGRYLDRSRRLRHQPAFFQVQDALGALGGARIVCHHD